MECVNQPSKWESILSNVILLSVINDVMLSTDPSCQAAAVQVSLSYSSLFVSLNNYRYKTVIIFMYNNTEKENLIRIKA